jgi:hypothetical protein
VVNAAIRLSSNEYKRSKMDVKELMIPMKVDNGGVGRSDNPM